MRVGVLGINYKSAEIGIREFVSKTCLKRLARDSQVAQKYRCVILSTCHRSEIYFSTENLVFPFSQTPLLFVGNSEIICGN